MARKQPIEKQEITFDDVKSGQIIRVIKDSKSKYYLVINTKRHINLVEVLLDQHFIYDEYHEEELDILQVYDSKNGNCIIYKRYEEDEGEEDV